MVTSPKYAGEPSAKALASGLATLGRYGDEYMVHAAEGETMIPAEVFEANPGLRDALFWQMQMMGIKDPNRFVVGNAMNSINPITGQPEFWFKKIFKKVKGVFKTALPVLAPLLGNMILPGIGGLIASGLVTKLSGGSWGDVLRGAAIGWATQGLTSGIGSSLSGGDFLAGVGKGLSDPLTAGANLLSGGAQNTFRQGILGGLMPGGGSGVYSTGLNSLGKPAHWSDYINPRYNPGAQLGSAMPSSVAAAGGTSYTQQGTGELLNTPNVIAEQQVPFDTTQYQLGPGGIKSMSEPGGADWAGDWDLDYETPAFRGAQAPPAPDIPTKEMLMRANAAQRANFAAQGGGYGDFMMPASIGTDELSLRDLYNQSLYSDYGQNSLKAQGLLPKDIAFTGPSIEDQLKPDYAVKPPVMTEAIEKDYTTAYLDSEGKGDWARVDAPGEYKPGRIINIRGEATPSGEYPNAQQWQVVETPPTLNPKTGVLEGGGQEFVKYEPPGPFDYGVTEKIAGGIESLGVGAEKAAKIAPWVTTAGVGAAGAGLYSLFSEDEIPEEHTPMHRDYDEWRKIEDKNSPEAIALYRKWWGQPFVTRSDFENRTGKPSSKPDWWFKPEDEGETTANRGGEVIGPGTGTSDSIPARLSDGEFVMTANAVRNAGNGDRNLGAARMYDMMRRFEGRAA